MRSPLWWTLGTRACWSTSARTPREPIWTGQCSTTASTTARLTAGATQPPCSTMAQPTACPRCSRMAARRTWPGSTPTRGSERMPRRVPTSTLRPSPHASRDGMPRRDASRTSVVPRGRRPPTPTCSRSARGRRSRGPRMQTARRSASVPPRTRCARPHGTADRGRHPRPWLPASTQSPRSPRTVPTPHGQRTRTTTSLHRARPWAPPGARCPRRTWPRSPTWSCPARRAPLLRLPLMAASAGMTARHGRRSCRRARWARRRTSAWTVTRCTTCGPTRTRATWPWPPGTRASGGPRS